MSDNCLSQMLSLRCFPNQFPFPMSVSDVRVRFPCPCSMKRHLGVVVELPCGPHNPDPQYAATEDQAAVSLRSGYLGSPLLSSAQVESWPEGECGERPRRLDALPPPHLHPNSPAVRRAEPSYLAIQIRQNQPHRVPIHQSPIASCCVWRNQFAFLRFQLSSSFWTMTWSTWP